ncbi:MAG: hypothetical protein U0Z53_11650 [Blastocatellia bacterium]
MSIRTFLILAVLALAGPVLPGAAVQAQSSAASSASASEPLTLSQLNILLRRQVGRDMTEGDIAARIDKFGIAFDPKPDVISRLRANGAHQHLINAIKRANERLIDAAGERAVSIRTAAPDPIIEEVRKNVMAYSDDLPDFICNQEITRYVDLEATGAWQKYDNLTYEVSYHKKSESYKPVNVIGRPVTLPLDQVGGATSSGDFGLRLSQLFNPDTKASFRAAGTDRLGARQTLIYDFTVAQPLSTWQIKSENLPPIIAGYSGTVWIDAETKRVLRIEMAADNLPRDYPVTQAEGSTDYDMVKLRGLEGEFLLPVRSETVMGDRRQRHFFRNISYYKFYRKFETDIKITDQDEKPEKP